MPEILRPTSSGPPRFRAGLWLVLALPAWVAVTLVSGRPVLESVAFYAPVVLVPAVAPLLRWPAAILAVAAVPLLAVPFLPDGVAAAPTVPWLVVAGLLALRDGVPVLLGRVRTMAGLGRSGAAAFLAVTAIWLTIGALGLRPLGFAAVIVDLTAIHFGVAGVVLLGTFVLAQERAPGRIGGLAIALLLAGMPVTALGFLGVPGASLVGALVVSAAGVLGGLGQLRIAGAARWDDASARALLAGSAICLIVAMGLAAGWAVSFETGMPWLDLDRMAAVHGSLNAFGFGLAATAGWLRLRAPR